MTENFLIILSKGDQVGNYIPVQGYVICRFTYRFYPVIISRLTGVAIFYWAIMISLATDLSFSMSIFFWTESLSLRSLILVMEFSTPRVSLNITEVISHGHNLPSLLMIDRSALALPSTVLSRSILL